MTNDCIIAFYEQNGTCERTRFGKYANKGIA